MQSMELAGRMQRIASFAAPKIFAALHSADTISFAGGLPDSALLDAQGIRESAARALSGAATPALQYGLAQGLPRLREVLSRHMRTQGIEIDPGLVLVTCGGQQALDLLAKVLVSPGDGVLVEAPTYVAAIECFKLYGARLIGVPADAHGLDVDALEAQIVRERPKLVYLVPTFGNPGGATLDLDRRLRVLDLVERHGLLLIEDDPYSELYFGEPPPPSLFALAQRHGVAAGRVAYCGSLSKILSPGLRIGWLAANSVLVQNATKCRLLGDTHTNALAQAIAADYLAHGRLTSVLKASRAAYASRASTLAEALQTQLGDRLSFRMPAGGLFLWARIADAGDGDDLADRAQEKRLLLLPGAMFYAAQPDRATVRLSFATATPAQIRDGVDRLRDAMNGA